MNISKSVCPTCNTVIGAGYKRCPVCRNPTKARAKVSQMRALAFTAFLMALLSGASGVYLQITTIPGISRNVVHIAGLEAIGLTVAWSAIGYGALREKPCSAYLTLALSVLIIMGGVIELQAGFNPLLVAGMIVYLGMAVNGNELALELRSKKRKQS